MKKRNVAMVSMLALGLFGFGTSAQAVEENSTAEIKVEPGDLTIKSKDNITFKYTITGQATSNHAENSKSKIVIEDLRGTVTEGWTLQVKIDEGFSQAQTQAESGIVLKFNPVLETNATAATSATQVSLNSNYATVASIANDQIASTDIATNIALNAKIDIPAKIKTKTYTANLTWNLQAGPTS